MDEYVIVKFFSKIAKKDPEGWSKVFDNEELKTREQLEEFDELFNSYRHFLNLNENSIFRVYELIVYNLNNITEYNVTKENVIIPQTKEFDVHYSQDYTEWGYEEGKNRYSASNLELAILSARFDQYNGNFDYDFDDRESTDYESDNFRVTRAVEVRESIKKSIKKALKEQYSLFIKKHI
jgi:hypothetical protein